MKIVTEFLEWNENLYQVLRSIRESHNPNVDLWKEHLMADTVLRREDFLYFCRKVEDAQIIVEEETTTQQNT